MRYNDPNATHDAIPSNRRFQIYNTRTYKYHLYDTTFELTQLFIADKFTRICEIIRMPLEFNTMYVFSFIIPVNGCFSEHCAKRYLHKPQV